LTPEEEPEAEIFGQASLDEARRIAANVARLLELLRKVR
jgi:hypothetical protein